MKFFFEKCYMGHSVENRKRRELKICHIFKLFHSNIFLNEFQFQSANLKFAETNVIKINHIPLFTEAYFQANITMAISSLISLYLLIILS